MKHESNPDHVKILNQGVEAWNKWRNENPEVKPDLRTANFVTADLFRINLTETNLNEADFSGANLNEADLSRATLSSARLHGTNLIRAVLKGASLQDVKLRGADLTGADLREAKFLESNLSRSSFRKANLRKANLNATNLSEAWFNDADIRDANLREANLLSADLSNADITGSKVYGTSFDDWVICNIKCNFIYLDKEGKTRFPKNRDFMPGEFEELYKSLPTVEYIFERGFTIIDMVLMNQVILEINERHPEFDLRIESFHSRGQPHAKFTIIERSYAEKAINQITNLFENKIRYIEGQRDQMNQLISMMTKTPQNITIGEQGIFVAGNVNGTQMTIGEKNKQICAKDIHRPTQIGKIATYNTKYFTERKMGDQITIKSGSGDINFAKDQAVATINKTVRNADMPEERKAKLKELTAAVDKMIKNMPDDKAQNVTENLEILVKQAEKEKPQKALCQVSADGLIEAAKALGTVAQPVITTVQAIMKLLIP